ncbi:MAG: hypothetical protein QXH73_04805 [Ignisphaera sp.]
MKTIYGFPDLLQLHTCLSIKHQLPTVAILLSPGFSPKSGFCNVAVCQL